MRLSRRLAPASSSGMAVSMIIAGMPFLPNASEFLVDGCTRHADPRPRFEFSLADAPVFDGFERLLRIGEFAEGGALGEALAVDFLAARLFLADEDFEPSDLDLDLVEAGAFFLLRLRADARGGLLRLRARGCIRQRFERDFEFLLAGFKFAEGFEALAGGAVAVAVVAERGALGVEYGDLGAQVGGEGFAVERVLRGVALGADSIDLQFGVVALFSRRT